MAQEADGQEPARQFGQQHAHGQPGVAVDGQARRVVAHQLLRVDVDADQLAIEGEAAVEHHVVVGFAQLGADGQHHVGLGGQLAYRHAGLVAAQQQRVVGR